MSRAANRNSAITIAASDTRFLLLRLSMIATGATAALFALLR